MKEMSAHEIDPLHAASRVDVAIVGAGVGGMAAALWCRRLELSFVLLERGARVGGQLFHIYNPIPDYLGCDGDGHALAARLEQQLSQLGIVPQVNTSVQGVQWDPLQLQLETHSITTRTLVIATGATRRKLNVPGAEPLRGKGVAYTYSGARESFEGRPVCVIGGGDGAFENALMLAAQCPRVYLLMRTRHPRARLDFVQQAQNHPHIEIIEHAHVEAIEGTGQVDRVLLHQDGKRRALDVNAVLIKIGLAPAVEWLPSELTRTKEGTLWTDTQQRTSHPCVWAVGDVCTPRDPSISVAVGQACIAVRCIERMLRRGA